MPAGPMTMPKNFWRIAFSSGVGTVDSGGVKFCSITVERCRHACGSDHLPCGLYPLLSRAMSPANSSTELNFSGRLRGAGAVGVATGRHGLTRKSVCPKLNRLAVGDHDFGDGSSRLGLDGDVIFHRLDRADLGLLVDHRADLDERLGVGCWSGIEGPDHRTFDRDKSRVVVDGWGGGRFRSRSGRS